MSGIITRQELHISLRQELDDVKNYISGSNNAEMGTHMANKSNPHAVTKSQIGLSNVINVLQASKSEFDSFTSRRDNPHGVTAAQVNAVHSARTVTGTGGCKGGGSLSGNIEIQFDTSYGDARYLGRTATASNSSKLGGYSASDFYRIGENVIDMGSGIQIRRNGNRVYVKRDGTSHKIYDDGSITSGRGLPTGGVQHDIYIQY